MYAGRSVSQINFSFGILNPNNKKYFIFYLSKEKYFVFFYSHKIFNISFYEYLTFLLTFGSLRVSGRLCGSSHVHV